jgi:hypothetical protein
MYGLFADWQPRYAAHRVATFPVRDKRPCIRGWQKVGLPGSAQLAMKFADANAFGFQCGARSRITLIDIDSPNEGVVGEAIKLFGESPIIWRTGSGNYAMPFRHNGETRRIRPVPGLPIDVLGGGYAVAPPSMGAKGHYEFLRGTLAELDRLPAAHIDKVAPTEAPKPDHDTIPVGKRNDALFRFALEQAPHVDNFDALLDVVRTSNMDCDPPLSDAEAVKAARSAWRYEQEGRNLVGRGRAIVTAHSMIDGLMHESPDAFVLLMLLERHHWGREFVLANAMALTMPGGGWPLRRFQVARAKLIERKHVELVRPAVQRHPATYRLATFRVSKNAHQHDKKQTPSFLSFLSPLGRKVTAEQVTGEAPSPATSSRSFEASPSLRGILEAHAQAHGDASGRRLVPLCQGRVTKPCDRVVATVKKEITPSAHPGRTAEHPGRDGPGP